jgi:hypothetical protein
MFFITSLFREKGNSWQKIFSLGESLPIDMDRALIHADRFAMLVHRAAIDSDRATIVPDHPTILADRSATGLDRAPIHTDGKTI